MVRRVLYSGGPLFGHRLSGTRSTSVAECVIAAGRLCLCGLCQTGALMDLQIWSSVMEGSPTMTRRRNERMFFAVAAAFLLFHRLKIATRFSVQLLHEEAIGASE